jgi:uncharacterized membrane protein YesL
MNIYETFAVLIFSVLFVRIYLSYRMDRLRGDKSTFLKVLFGGYAFAGVFPVFKTPQSFEESKLKKLSNSLFVVFWLLFITLMVIIWAKYR